MSEKGPAPVQEAPKPTSEKEQNGTGEETHGPRVERTPFYRRIPWVKPVVSRENPRPPEQLEREKNYSKNEEIESLINLVRSGLWAESDQGRRMKERYGDNGLGRFKAFLSGEMDAEVITHSHDVYDDDDHFVQRNTTSTIERHYGAEVGRKIFNVGWKTGATAAGTAIIAGLTGVGALAVPALLGAAAARGGVEVVRSVIGKERRMREELMMARARVYQKAEELADRIPSLSHAPTIEMPENPTPEDYDRQAQHRVELQRWQEARNQAVQDLVNFVHASEQNTVKFHRDENGMPFIDTASYGAPHPEGTDPGHAIAGGPTGPTLVHGTEAYQPSEHAPGKTIDEMEKEAESYRRRWEWIEEGLALVGGIGANVANVLHLKAQLAGELAGKLQEGGSVALDIDKNGVSHAVHFAGNIGQHIADAANKLVFDFNNVFEALKSSVAGANNLGGPHGGSHLVFTKAAETAHMAAGQVIDAIERAATTEAIKNVITAAGGLLARTVWRGTTNELRHKQWKKDREGLKEEQEILRRRLQPDKAPTVMEQLKRRAAELGKEMPAEGQLWRGNIYDDSGNNVGLNLVKILKVMDGDHQGYVRVQASQKDQDYDVIELIPIDDLLKNYVQYLEKAGPARNEEEDHEENDGGRRRRRDRDDPEGGGGGGSDDRETPRPEPPGPRPARPAPRPGTGLGPNRGGDDPGLDTDLDPDRAIPPVGGPARPSVPPWHRYRPEETRPILSRRGEPEPEPEPRQIPQAAITEPAESFTPGEQNVISITTPPERRLLGPGEPGYVEDASPVPVMPDIRTSDGAIMRINLAGMSAEEREAQEVLIGELVDEYDPELPLPLAIQTESVGRPDGITIIYYRLLPREDRIRLIEAKKRTDGIESERKALEGAPSYILGEGREVEAGQIVTLPLSKETHITPLINEPYLLINGRQARLDFLDDGSTKNQLVALYQQMQASNEPYIDATFRVLPPENEQYQAIEPTRLQLVRADEVERASLGRRVAHGHLESGSPEHVTTEEALADADSYRERRRTVDFQTEGRAPVGQTFELHFQHPPIRTDSTLERINPDKWSNDHRIDEFSINGHPVDLELMVAQSEDQQRLFQYLSEAGATNIKIKILGERFDETGQMRYIGRVVGAKAEAVAALEGIEPKREVSERTRKRRAQVEAAKILEAEHAIAEVEIHVERDKKSGKINYSCTWPGEEELPVKLKYYNNFRSAGPGSRWTMESLEHIREAEVAGAPIKAKLEVEYMRIDKGQPTLVANLIDLPITYEKTEGKKSLGEITMPEVVVAPGTTLEMQSKQLRVTNQSFASQEKAKYPMIKPFYLNGFLMRLAEGSAFAHQELLNEIKNNAVPSVEMRIAVLRWNGNEKECIYTLVNGDDKGEVEPAPNLEHGIAVERRAINTRIQGYLSEAVESFNNHEDQYRLPENLQARFALNEYNRPRLLVAGIILDIVGRTGGEADQARAYAAANSQNDVWLRQAKDILVAHDARGGGRGVAGGETSAQKKARELGELEQAISDELQRLNVIEEPPSNKRGEIEPISGLANGVEYHPRLPESPELASLRSDIQLFDESADLAADSHFAEYIKPVMINDPAERLILGSLFMNDVLPDAVYNKRAKAVRENLKRLARRVVDEGADIAERNQALSEFNDAIGNLSVYEEVEVPRSKGRGRRKGEEV